MYVELSKLQQSQDFEKALKVTNKILNLAPSDATAFHCKIVCMIQVDVYGNLVLKLLVCALIFHQLQHAWSHDNFDLML